MEETAAGWCCRGTGTPVLPHVKQQKQAESGDPSGVGQREKGSRELRAVIASPVLEM